MKNALLIADRELHQRYPRITHPFRTVRKLSDGARWLRGQRSTEHEEREIDKAHVLRAAESPWLEVSTVGLSCRLLIAGTMQQMALIAIPTLSSHSRILLRSLSLSGFLSLSLFLPSSPLSLSLFSTLPISHPLHSMLLSSTAPAVFLASFFAAFLPADLF